jgi:hypothetical protein
MGSKIRLTAIAVGAMAVVLGFGPGAGFRYEGPGSNPDYHVVNTGNDIAGHVSGAQGSIHAL